MAKKKKSTAPLVRAQGTCETSQHLADRLWREGIAVPKGMTLHYSTIDSRKGRIYADHPMCRFYGSSAIRWETVNRAKGEYATADERAKANVDALTTRELRDFVNGARGGIRNFTEIARLDILFRLSDAYKVIPADMANALNRDDMGNPRAPIGFDSVFLNLANERGVSQADVETALWVEVKRIKTMQNVICGQPGTDHTPRSQVISVVRQGFSNRTVEQLRAIFGSNYRNMNKLYDPVFQRLAPFNGCIWGAKPLATNLILGDWIYKSSVTPTMLSRTAIPESIRLGLKGRQVNDLVDTPVFGKTQTIIHVAELKNGQTSITMTPETVPYRGLENPAMVRKLAA